MDLGTVTSYLPALSADWVIFGTLATFFTFDALRAGAGRVTALAFSLPLALLLSTYLPETAYLAPIMSASSAVATGALIGLTIVLFVVLYRLLDTGTDSARPHLALLAGVSAAAVCIVVLVQLPAGTIPWTFGETFSAIFGEAYRLYWFLGAYLALAIARG